MARRERARVSGCLLRELARYERLSEGQRAALEAFYGLDEAFKSDLLFQRHHLQLDAQGEVVQTHQGARDDGIRVDVFIHVIVLNYIKPLLI